MLRRVAVTVAILWSAPVAAQTATVTGAVTDGSDPIEGAIVCGMNWDQDGRVSVPEEECAYTGADGSFSIETMLIENGADTIGQVTAGAEGYLTTDLYVDESATNDIALELLTLDEPDNPSYVWWSPYNAGCRQCHVSLVDQWNASRHRQAAEDPWVLDMYNGTTREGEGAAGGPGYKVDHEDAGPCGGCHAAAASWEAGEAIDLNEVPSEHQYGVYCETCHKIRDVDPNGAGGVGGSITMWRPDERFSDGAGGYVQFAFGPYANVVTHSMTSSYLPLQSSARLCSGCHEWNNAQDVPVMDTYTDWLAVGDPDETAPCQSCHMQNNLGLPEFEPMEWLVDDPHMRGMSGQRRDPATIFRHDFYGGQTLAPYAMDLLLEAEQEGDELVVRTSSINVGANHRVPTGMPIREIILVVEVTPSGGGEALELADGPVIAARGGDLAGLAGTVFAKSLGDEEGNLTFAFWDATQTLEDTRLAPGERREDEFRFAVPESMSVDVTARLVYRRASKLLADEKGWDPQDQEIGLEETSLALTVDDADAGADGGTAPAPRTGCACGQVGARQPIGWLGVAALLVVLQRLASRRRTPR